MGWVPRFWTGMFGPAVDTAALMRHVWHGPRLRLQHLTKAVPADREPDWVLVLGEVMLGRLWDDEEESDFPWNVCLFQPLPAFDQVRPLFEALQAALVAEHYEHARRIATEIDNHQLKVVWPDTPAMPDLAMGLQIAAQWAWFRNRPRHFKR